jgi:ribosomal protein S7
MNKKELRKKLLNHLTKYGKKHKSEKTVIKSFKLVQKRQKKNHNKTIKFSILNTIPVFKIVKLTNKKRRKKSIKKIPILLSNYESRTSWGLKYLIKNATPQTKQSAFFTKLENEFLLAATSNSNAVKIKDSLQNEALQEKKSFRFYRW